MYDLRLCDKKIVMVEGKYNVRKEYIYLVHYYIFRIRTPGGGLKSDHCRRYV